MQEQGRSQRFGSLKSEQNTSSRREFLSQSGKLLAVSALAGVSTSGIYAAGDNTIRLALIGCGGRGSGAVADAFAAKGGPVKLYAMADLFEDRLSGSYKNLNGRFAAKMEV